MPAPNWDTMHWEQDPNTTWSALAFDVDGSTPLFLSNAGTPFYGDLLMYATGGWSAGYRPGSVEVSMTVDPAMISETSAVQVRTATQSAQAYLLGASFPVTIDLSGLTEDITELEFIDFHSDTYPGRVDSVVFSGEAGCAQFWMNHVGQREIDP